MAWFYLAMLGRNTGVEPVHARFTAGCVHRFTNCAVLDNYIYPIDLSQRDFGLLQPFIGGVPYFWLSLAMARNFSSFSFILSP